jgi:FMN-dependent oxidoreductase (nitrilotriacetate monooxygenase family)
MIDHPVHRKMKLGAFFHPTGNHVASWLQVDTQIDAGTNVAHYIELAHIAESAKFDLIFLADALTVRAGNLEVLSRWPQYMVFFDPIILLSAIASVTTRIGLVCTATTSYNEPYNVARRFASFDHVSHGRAGWNVVTSGNQSEAFNFGRSQHFQHDEAYARATEFADVVFGLWDSYDDNAFVRDRITGRYFDPEKLHFLNHKGKYFSVKGPLNMARPPQGRPVIFQAGSSEAGRELAARIAEGVFTPQHTIAAAQKFSEDLRRRMTRFGRSPHHVKIMPGLNPIVGRTEREAREKYRHLQSLIHPDVGRELLSNALGDVDLRGLPLDEPIPAWVFEQPSIGHTTLVGVVQNWARNEGLTLKQLYERFAGARGQRTVIGSAVQIADDMEKWFCEGAVDGFLIQPSCLPGDFRDFAELVVPELQNRGLFRADYEGESLRDHLGLDRPVSRYQS